MIADPLLSLMRRCRVRWLCFICIWCWAIGTFAWYFHTPLLGCLIAAWCIRKGANAYASQSYMPMHRRNRFARQGQHVFRVGRFANREGRTM